MGSRDEVAEVRELDAATWPQWAEAESVSGPVLTVGGPGLTV